MRTAGSATGAAGRAMGTDLSTLTSGLGWEIAWEIAWTHAMWGWLHKVEQRRLVTSLVTSIVSPASTVEQVVGEADGADGACCSSEFGFTWQRGW